MRSRDDEDQGRRDWRGGDEQQQQGGGYGGRDYGSNRGGRGQQEQFTQPGSQYGSYGGGFSSGYGGGYGADNASSSYGRGAGGPNYQGAQGGGQGYGGGGQNYGNQGGGYAPQQQQSAHAGPPVQTPPPGAEAAAPRPIAPPMSQPVQPSWKNESGEAAPAVETPSENQE